MHITKLKRIEENAQTAINSLSQRIHSKTHLCYASFVGSKLLNVVDVSMKILKFVHSWTKRHNFWSTTTVREWHRLFDVSYHIKFNCNISQPYILINCETLLIKPRFTVEEIKQLAEMGMKYALEVHHCNDSAQFNPM